MDKIAQRQLEKGRSELEGLIARRDMAWDRFYCMCCLGSGGEELRRAMRQYIWFFDQAKKLQKKVGKYELRMRETRRPPRLLVERVVESVEIKEADK